MEGVGFAPLVDAYDLYGQGFFDDGPAKGPVGSAPWPAAIDPTAPEDAAGPARRGPERIADLDDAPPDARGAEMPAPRAPMTFRQQAEGFAHERDFETACLLQALRAG